MYRILIVEDDQVIGETLQRHLKAWGYEAVCVKDFDRVLEEFAAVNPQLVLLDIGLPVYNGYHWCGEIRKLSKVPVLFLSSASDNMNIVMAMNMGGDDFIAKPFDLEVLAAKVQALLRRAYSFWKASGILEHCGAILNPGSGILSWNGEQVELTRNELRILQILFENAGKTVSRDAMMMKLWENDSFIDDNTLTVNITRLRRKLDGIGLKEFILTKKGIGYMLAG